MRQGKLAAFTRRLGVYKFLPLFFLLGAGIELFMIKVRVGRETFCKYPSRTKTQVVGFFKLIDQKIFARVIDQTWTVKKAGYRLRFFLLRFEGPRRSEGRKNCKKNEAILNPVTLITEHADGQFLIWGSDFFQQDRSRKSQGRMGLSCTCMLGIFWCGPALKFCSQAENVLG